MARLSAFILGFWMSVAAAVAQPASSIEDVIGSQLRAFTDRDVEAAWQYASPNIKQMFGNPANFGMMVERGYPMVWDNAEVRFLEQRDIGGAQWQKIMIRDAKGGLHLLDYQMVETAEGWQINGVQLLPSPDLGV
jgi:hypothetical protein